MTLFKPQPGLVDVKFTPVLGALGHGFGTCELPMTSPQGLPFTTDLYLGNVRHAFNSEVGKITNYKRPHSLEGKSGLIVIALYLLQPFWSQEFFVPLELSLKLWSVSKVTILTFPTLMDFGWRIDMKAGMDGEFLLSHILVHSDFNLTAPKGLSTQHMTILPQLSSISLQFAIMFTMMHTGKALGKLQRICVFVWIMIRRLPFACLLGCTTALVIMESRDGFIIFQTCHTGTQMSLSFGCKNFLQHLTS